MPIDSMKASYVLDVEKIRMDFPILSIETDGRRLVYLDNAATTQKPRRVIEAVSRFYETMNANVHRGVYRIAIEATEAYEASRRGIAEFLNAESWREIIFTRNATESLNLVAYAYALRNLRAGDKIVLTEMEHHSNMVPWQIVAGIKGASISYIPITSDGVLDLTRLDHILRDARVVSIVHASNVLGTINDVETIVREARREGAVTVIDAAQSVPHMPIDVQSIGCDFLAFSGHKMLGPMGIGGLYGSQRVLGEMEPFLGGGEMIREVSLEGAKWNDLPWKFEAGTPNVADAVGLGEAVKYLRELGMNNVRRHEEALTSYALERMSRVPHLKILGPESPAQRCGLIAFNIADIHPHDLAEYLDAKYGIAIRAGHHCAMPLHTKLGLIASARASFYIYNTFEEVDLLVEALESALTTFKAL